MSRHAGAHDNRPLEARKDVLTYTTQPLESDLEIIGSAQVVLIIQSSLPHSDFFARLLLGSEVAELVNDEVETGSYDIDFNASDLPSGVYFYRIRA